LLIFDAQSPKPKTTVPLEHNPNSVSMDADGEIITVAEGNPPGTPGLFRRFDFSGTQVWQFETGNMNWPIAVSADGSAIAAGGDDGHLYYFLP
jgi:outer membrane protein assembly factor BamB